MLTSSIIGIFGAKASLAQLGVQALGVVACGATSLVCAGLIFFAIKRTLGLRVGLEEEVEGLDAGEHGMHAYIFDEAGPFRGMR